MLIDIPYKSKSKKESFRLRRWHSVVNFDEFWSLILEYRPKGTLWLKQEAFIVAFAVSDINWASYFIRLARLLGLKDSGIRSIQLQNNHVFMDVTSTEKMHVPISDNVHGILISENYGRYLLSLANSLLLRTKRRLKKFYNAMSILLNEITRNSKFDPNEIGFTIFREII